MTIAREVGPYNIRCNCVAPGPIATELMANYVKRIAAEEGVPEAVINDRLLSECVLKICSTPEDVANLALFLASDQARTITGQSRRRRWRLVYGLKRGLPVALASKPLTPRIGSELQLDLQALLGGAAAAEIRALLEQRGVLILRGVDIADPRPSARSDWAASPRRASTGSRR